MAKRKSNRKSPRSNKIEPSELTLLFSTSSTSPGASTDSYIDLSQVASLVNRRFYRQGLNWAVAGFKFLTPTPAGGASIKASVTVQKLPNTWIMSNAWEKSMRTWMEMNNKALEETESIRPRFMDFKIYADSAHHQLGSSANLIPFNSAGAATEGDWDYSTIQVPDTDDISLVDQRVVNEFDLIATGGNYPGVSPVTTNNAVSLIEGYAASRALPNILDPNTPDDARDITGPDPNNWMSAIFNEGLIQDSAVITDLQTQNEIAPYPFENDGTNLDTMYPGGANQLAGLQIHDLSNISATTIGGQTFAKGGNFPCGLVKITHAVDTESIAHNLAIIVDLVPGTHRGYMAEPMTEM